MFRKVIFGVLFVVVLFGCKKTTTGLTQPQWERKTKILCNEISYMIEPDSPYYYNLSTPVDSIISPTNDSLKIDVDMVNGNGGVTIILLNFDTSLWDTIAGDTGIVSRYHHQIVAPFDSNVYYQVQVYGGMGDTICINAKVEYIWWVKK
ncbi:MAG: hypothetical protein PHX21_12695 [bacterium]|nr:hypothetical protein [bacterium]